MRLLSTVFAWSTALVTVAAMLTISAADARGVSPYPWQIAPMGLQTRVMVAQNGARIAVPRPYTPGVGPRPLMISPASPLRAVLTTSDIAAENQLKRELTSPERSVFRPTLKHSPLSIVSTNSAIGIFPTSGFSATGSFAILGIPNINFVVPNGNGNFYQTVFLSNNQCFEYGINYSATTPTLFVYNWCRGSNLPDGFINSNLVGYPGGKLNTWSSSGYGGFFAEDTTHGAILTVTLEEVQESDGWHLLGYNYAGGRYIDMLGKGVTGTQGQSVGWAVYEPHLVSHISCNSGNFPTGQTFLEMGNIYAQVGGVWLHPGSISGSFTFDSNSDCADLNGGPGYSSPYYSGGHTANNQDWWMNQR